MYSRDQLEGDFRKLGVAYGDVVMLHASVKAVGEIAGGPDQIHLALKQALTAEGTLMMYASCPGYYDEVGRGHLTADQEKEILDKLPAFDPLTARSQRDNGVLVEFLRTYPGSLVNHHVARFVVWGKHAEYLISEQPWHYPFGFGSPLDRFLELEGKILLLGCDHDNVTFLHYAEHVVDIPGKRIARYRVPVDENGARVWRDMEEFDTSDLRAHPNWPDRFFANLVDAFLATKRDRGGRVGDAQSNLLSARELRDFALPWMRSVATDASAAQKLLLFGRPVKGGRT
jgi:aminoglycoside 3-N-acetyltransferase